MIDPILVGIKLGKRYRPTGPLDIRWSRQVKSEKCWWLRQICIRYTYRNQNTDTYIVCIYIHRHLYCMYIYTQTLILYVYIYTDTYIVCIYIYNVYTQTLILYVYIYTMYIHRHLYCMYIHILYVYIYIVYIVHARRSKNNHVIFQLDLKLF